MTFGTTRYYRVAARNGQGLGAWSDPPHASATTLSGVPGRPVLIARATDANTIELTWTVPADNGDPITGYEIEWSEDGSANSWSSLTNVVPPDTSYEDAVLDPGTQRHYRIRAVNGEGAGSWSTERNAATPPAVPGAPTLRAEANGENAINLAWDPPTDNGGADITQYELQVSADGGTNYSRLTSPSASDRSYTHSGLKPGDQRHYQLRARNRAGLGEFSSAISATTLTGVPAAPGLTVRANGPTEIKLSWTKPDDRGSEIRRYELEVSDDGNVWRGLAFNISDNDSEYVHGSLTAGSTKYYRIRAVNGNGAGQWSSIRSASTDAGGPDAPVLTAAPASDNQIDFNWTVPADNGSSIRGYWVERSVDGNEPWERLTSSHSITTYSDSTLYRGMKRHYRVAAYNGVGTGPYSDVKSATTTGVPATAPPAPTLVRVSSVSRGQVTLEWAAPEDDGGAPLSGYEYDYSVGTACGNDGDEICFTYSDVTQTRSTSARITGLTASGLYNFGVRAVNPVGKGDWGRVQGRLAPASDAGVRVSSTSFTVDEGDPFSYTVILATEPPQPVLLITQPRGGNRYLDSSVGGRFLTPDGWTHPERDWSSVAFEWDKGVTINHTAKEDGDAEDDATVIDMWVQEVDCGLLYVADADKAQCQRDWKESSYRNLAGPSVLVVIEDND